MPKNHQLIIIFPDGTTYSSLEGCLLASLPAELSDDEIEERLDELDYPHAYLADLLANQPDIDLEEGTLNA